MHYILITNSYEEAQSVKDILDDVFKDTVFSLRVDGNKTTLYAVSEVQNPDKMRGFADGILYAVRNF